MNNCKNPLKLNLHSEGYKVNKPNDQSGEYVDKAIADDLLKACESVDKWLMEGWTEDDLNTAIHPLFKKALLKTREAIKKATE